MPITDVEIADLKATTSEIEWNAVCDRIKNARDGRYPNDWWERVKLSGLMDQIVRSWSKK